MKRRRKMRSAWNWATKGTLEWTDTSSQDVCISGPLLPAPRVDWLLEQGRGRDHLTVTAILLWLDFAFVNGTESDAQLQGLDFWVIKERFDSIPGGNLYKPYGAPQVPGNVTSWFVTDPLEEEDGLDPYLWTHHMSQIVAGTSVNSVLVGAGAANTSGLITANGAIQPNNNVRQAWQPDVVIKTRRRMVKGDCLNIGFTGGSGAANGVIYNLAYNARILTT